MFQTPRLNISSTDWRVTVWYVAAGRGTLSITIYEEGKPSPITTWSESKESITATIPLRGPGRFYLEIFTDNLLSYMIGIEVPA
jgi:hypothetical protein